jgi:DDE superfamily endonuclease/Helix-turn-helix of DDE superfamily endonuclease
MKNLLNYIEDSPHLFHTFLGISQPDFHALVQQVNQALQAQQQSLEENQVRVNAKGAGRPHKLTLSESLALTLFYLRNNPIFELLGFIFDVSRSKSHYTFHQMLPWIQQFLPASLFEECIDDPDLWAMHQEALIEEQLLVDSTEQAMERPTEQEVQKTFYSGKKKQHTIKSSFIVTCDGLEIVDVVLGVPGPTSDIRLFREQQEHLDMQQQYLGDKAYVGARATIFPKKKPRNGKLTTEEKEENRKLSRQRIFVEHLIRRLKIFRILKDCYRLNRQSYRTVISSICGLVRLRLGRLDLRDGLSGANPKIP